MIGRPQQCVESGSATVLASVLIGLLSFVTAGCLVVAGIFVGHRRAQASADLAALAAASAAQRGSSPCAAAEAVAGANRSRILGCRVDAGHRGEVVTVRVRSAGPRVFGRIAWTEASARAGPVGTDAVLGQQPR